jgi:DNA-binding phage protein
MLIQEFISLVKQRIKETKTNVLTISNNTGLSKAYLYELLSGKKRWNEKTISIICKELGINVEFKLKQ